LSLWFWLFIAYLWLCTTLCILWGMANVYRATYQCVYEDGTLALPGFHYQTDLPNLGDEPAIDDVAAAISGLLTFPLQDASPAGVTIVSLEVVEEVTGNEVPAATSYVVGENGQLDVGDGDLPKGCVAIIAKKTNASSRSARGHVTPPGPMNTAYLTDGNWSGLYVEKLGDLASVMSQTTELGDLQPTTLRPVVYSRHRAELNQDPFTFDIVGAVPRLKAHWLRSRQSSP
jgi:hypothetical protein